jgi:hypothetical protein
MWKWLTTKLKGLLTFLVAGAMSIAALASLM